MLNIGIIGQKWLAAEVFKELNPAHRIVYVAAPGSDDRLYKVAKDCGVSAMTYGRQPLSQLDLPAVDLLICAHAFVRVPDSVLGRAGAAIGYHPSLLPLHKGMRSIEETLAAGDPVTGGTVYHLTDEMDGGPVVFQDWCFVHRGETAAELWRRALAPMGFELLVKAVDYLQGYGFLPAEEQQTA